MKIEEVPLSEYRQTAFFIANGARDQAFSDGRAEGIEYYARQNAVNTRIWRAWEGSRCLAAAMIAGNPGRMGTMMFSPMSAPGVHAESLVLLLQEFSRRRMQEGLAMIQVLLTGPSPADTEILTRAGFHFLAQLQYMRMNVSDRKPVPLDQHVTWKPFGQFNETQLGEVISHTYQGSRDCPKLCGKRKLPDVIASHKVSGIFTPQTWWLCEWDSKPAGCLLVNDSAASREAELVYVGVVPEYRGRGLCRFMVRHAAHETHRRGRSYLTLAVDVVNHYARRVYESEGFVGGESRWAYAAFAT